jgi:hypothetical protein
MWIYLNEKILILIYGNTARENKNYFISSLFPKTVQKIQMSFLSRVEPVQHIYV